MVSIVVANLLDKGARKFDIRPRRRAPEENFERRCIIDVMAIRYQGMIDKTWRFGSSREAALSHARKHFVSASAVENFGHLRNRCSSMPSTSYFTSI